MDPAIGVVVFYGLFSIIGGIIGYVKAQSKASLIAGSVSGLAMLACAYGMRKGNLIAASLAILISILLGARFLGTWLKKHRVMPDLLMVLFSLATLIAVGLKMGLKIIR